MRFAPWRSPLGSPALMNMRMRMASLPEIKHETRDKETRGKNLSCLLVSCLSFGWHGDLGLQRLVARQRGRLGDAAISEGAQHFQHFAPGREGAAVVPLVAVHRLHELDFVLGIILLAGGRIDLTAAGRDAAARA